jgi:hypothetical protein
MQGFTNAWFRRFARKARLSDQALCEAVLRAERGLIDAELGGGLIKQRVARAGGGRSGGYRRLLVFRSGSMSVFVFGFAKSERDNIGPDDEVALKALAKVLLGLDGSNLRKLVDNGTLFEVRCDT